MRLRSLLLRWLLVPTLTLWVAAFAISYLRSLAQAHEAYDRTLLGSALVVGESLRSEDGAIVADLSPAALEMLRTDAHDRIYYRISEEGRHLSGYPELPPPRVSPSAEPVFYDTELLAQPVRAVAIRRTLVDRDSPRALLVQVAETMEARRELTRRMVLESAAMQLVLIAAAAGLITLGVRRGLAPLKRLRNEVRARAADDLTPIATRAVPREVAPLIEALNAHTERQRQLSELQARFVANASHQLKTPLTLLRAQIDHARRQGSLEAMRGVLEQIHESTEGTQRLVAQLLTLARSEPGRALATEAVDLAALAREVSFDLLGLARARSIDLGFEGDQAVPVAADRVLLREAIANLVHNAIHYTPTGSIVTVRASRAAGGARLSVCDDGPGIPAEERGRVLERFYRRPGAGGQGSGLGLAIVKEICERHGATLRLMDGPGGRGLCAEIGWRG
jgi:two-component system sensor histidine kinase TctE